MFYISHMQFVNLYLRFNITFCCDPQVQILVRKVRNKAAGQQGMWIQPKLVLSAVSAALIYFDLQVVQTVTDHCAVLTQAIATSTMTGQQADTSRCLVLVLQWRCHMCRHVCMCSLSHRPDSCPAHLSAILPSCQMTTSMM